MGIISIQYYHCYLVHVRTKIEGMEKYLPNFLSQKIQPIRPILQMSALSAYLAKILIFPLQILTINIKTARIIATQYPKDTSDRNELKHLRKQIRNYINRAIWRGPTNNLYRFIFIQSCNFTGKEVSCQDIRNQVNVEDKEKVFWATAMFAGGNGAFFASLVYFYDLLKGGIRNKKLEENQNQQHFWKNSIRTTFWRRKWMALTVYQLFLLTNFIYRGLYFGGYDYGKLLLKQNDPKTEPSWFSRLLLAHSVVFTAQILTYPIDWVREMLFQDLSKPQQSRQFRGFFHCCQHIYQTEGLRGFFRKSQDSVLRQVSQALVLVIYDTMKKHYIQQ